LVEPGWRRDPAPRVLCCRESGDEATAGPAAFQVNGGVGVGVPRVKCGGAVGQRGRGGPRHGGRPSAFASQPARNSTGGGCGGHGDPGRRLGRPSGARIPPPVPRRVRPPAVEEAGPAGMELGARVRWRPPGAPIQLEECRLRALYEAIPVPKQGPEWQRWLMLHPEQ